MINRVFASLENLIVAMRTDVASFHDRWENEEFRTTWCYDHFRRRRSGQHRFIIISETRRLEQGRFIINEEDVLNNIVSYFIKSREISDNVVFIIIKKICGDVPYYIALLTDIKLGDFRTFVLRSLKKMRHFNRRHFVIINPF